MSGQSRGWCPVTTKDVSHAPAKWTWSLLPEVARLESGHTPSRRVPAYWEGGDVPWLSLKDIRGLRDKYVTQTVDRPTPLGIDNSSARVLPKGTVALCRTASVGNVAILGCDMATSQDFVNWVCGPKLLPEYLYWAFRSSEATFDLEKQGSTHQTIYMPVVERFRVLLPPLDEQRRIAEVLDRAEGLRGKRRAALDQLDTLTQSIFLDLFGDDVSQTAPLGELVEEFRYGTSNKSALTGKPTLRIPNVVGGAMDLSEIKTVPMESAEFRRLQLREGDLLIVRTNGNPDYVGRCAVFERLAVQNSGFDQHEFVYASYLIRARPKVGLILPLFLREFLLGKEGRKALRAGSKTSAGQFNINTESLAAIQVPVPPLSAQQVFVDRVAAVEKVRAAQRRSVVELDALFASLQHRAFRGEL